MFRQQKSEQENVVFSCYQDAVDFKENANLQLQKINEAKTISIVGTVLGFFPISPIFTIISIIISFRCYKKIGCLNNALKWGVNCSKWGWIMCPVFPLDLIIGVVGIIVGIYCFFLLPYFALIGVRKKAEKDIIYAETYISNHKPQSEGIVEN